jgi:hypothetical protein
MIRVEGATELLKAMEKVEPGPLRKTLQRGTNAGGKYLKPKVQAAAPKRTGRLRKSISTRQARRNRPATVIGARPKVAFYRHMVIGGTKAHRIRFPDQKAAGVPKSDGNIRHPGARANPFIERTADAKGDEALDLAIRLIREDLP